MKENENSKKINKCIYCQAKDVELTDEHVMPFALGWDLVLEKAVCKVCQVITGKCEPEQLKRIWAEVRACIGIRSRRRKFATETFPLEVVLNDGTHTTLNLKSDEVLGMAQFLEYDLPASIKPDIRYTGGINIKSISNYNFGIKPETLAKKYHIKEIKQTTVYKGNLFAQMLAKIAYCFTIFTFGPDYLEECFVLPLILGQDENPGLYIGCDETGQFFPRIGKQKNGLHAIKLFVHEIEESPVTLIEVKIKFFASAVSETPEYIVIVGTRKKSQD